MAPLPKFPIIDSSDMEKNACQAQLWFLEDAELFRTVKPYWMSFPSPDPNIPRTNVIYRKADMVSIRDARDLSPLDFDRVGFAFVEIESELKFEDCGDRKKVEQLYLKDLKDLFCKFFQTSHVVILDHTVRTQYNWNAR